MTGTIGYHYEAGDGGLHDHNDGNNGENDDHLNDEEDQYNNRQDELLNERIIGLEEEDVSSGGFPLCPSRGRPTFYSLMAFASENCRNALRRSGKSPCAAGRRGHQLRDERMRAPRTALHGR